VIKSSLAIVLLFAGVVLCSCAAADDTSSRGSCGDGKRQATEQCDGTDLDSKTCATEGMSGGTLSCSPTCTLDTSACCKDSCPNLGDTMCLGEQIMTCGKSAGNCRAWVQTTDCSASGKVCNSTAGKVSCKGSNCLDSCSTAGATQCNGASVETCSEQPNGCLGWSPSEDCSAQSQACTVTAGVAQCGACTTGSCTVGDKQCSGNVLQTCSDASGCPTWTNQTDCGAEGLSCVASGGVFACKGDCTDKCGSGLKICMNNSVTQCEIGSDGCLDWVTKDVCSQNQQICQMGATGAKCVYDCSNPCPTVGAQQCNANTVETCTQLGNCQEWKTASTCPLGQACNDSGGTFSCIAGAPTGEDCGHVIPVQAGDNTISWTATTNNYMPSSPACTYYNVVPPDVVLAYQSAFTGTLEYTLPNPTYTTWVVMASTGTCGDLTSPVSCAAEWNTDVTDSISVSAGTTYFFYVSATNDLSNPLGNPFTFHLTEIDCSAFQAGTVTESPANGATTTSLNPTLTVVFETSINTTAGTVTLTGDKGTTLSYSVATASEISFPTSDDKTMQITPSQPFKAGEHITVSWTGMTDVKCNKAIAAASWSFTVVTPPCSPGQSGMLAGTVTKVTTALSSSPYYGAADDDPNGWVYFGDYSGLSRVSKSGSSVQAVNTLAGLGSNHLGYEVLTAGNNVFTLDDKSAATAGYLWRITTDAGASWQPQDMASFATAPAAEFDAARYYKGKVYMATSAYTPPTQIYSVDVSTGTPPQAATLEVSVAGETGCTGLAVDDQYFYLACGDDVLRADRTSGATTLLSNTYSLSFVKDSLYAADTNSDGKADYLYFRGYEPIVAFVCDPGGTTPYVDTLVTWSTYGSNYGMGYDATANKIYLFDQGSSELVSIK
jgi:methionine-rich copper-binding protein CopC